MSTLSQCRLLSGCRAFTSVRPTSARKITNGTKVFMRRKDSYMVEVEIGEEEPEDIAVRRFMKAVTESRIIDKMRVRRYTETKVEMVKRRLRERIERRKMGIVDPTWEEIYGQDTDPKPFEMFFTRDGDGNESFFLPPIGGQDDFFPGNYTDMDSAKWGYYDSSRGGYAGGGYISGAGPSTYAGGYINQMGGYINQGGYPSSYNQNMGGYINQGGAGGYQQGGYGGYQQGMGATAPQDAVPEPDTPAPGSDDTITFNF